MRDSRLAGSTAENIFLCILNERGVFATSFDTVAFDGIVYDTNRRYFKVGGSPHYMQIKCRGSEGKHYNPQGHSRNTIDGMQRVAQHLDILESSLYFVVGFYKQGDIRTAVYYGILLEELDRFKKAPTSQYRFSVERCEQEMKSDGAIFKF